MKNRYRYILILIFYFCFITNNSIANDNFIFESESIELKEDGNLIIARDGVEINSKDGLKIFANESKYSKISNKLFLIGNIKIIDDQKNLIIKSENLEYDKNLEEIISIGKTLININNSYNITTADVTYSRSNEKVKSDKKTTLLDNFTNKIETSSFIYLIDKKEFKSKDLILSDKYLNKYFSNEAIINLTKNEIAAKDIEVYFSKNGDFGDHARLKGNSMTSDNNVSTIKKGIFTTCKETDSCPPWSMQSEEIVHNKNKKTINYKNAWLKLYDVPVFYFPKFFHPDPTVKRQSGFLIPSIASSTVHGNSIKIPYFNVIAENKDFTITPRIFFNNDILIQNEYRQVEKNSNHITDFSIKKQDASTKSHFFSNTQIFLDESFFETSDVEINIEKTTNDTYLKSDNIENDVSNNQTLLNSYVKLDGNREDLNFYGEISAYEDLTKEKSSDKFQYILPSFSLSKVINTNKDLKGNLTYKATGTNQQRDTNISESYFNNDLEYDSNLIILKNGFVNNFNLMFKNVSKKGKNSNNYNDNFENDNFFSSIFTSSLPLKKNYNNFNSNLTPKASLRLSPNESENLSKLDRQINSTNLFSKNRLGLSDSLEGSQSLTVGVDYSVFKKDNYKIFSSNLGQVFRSKKDDKLPLSSTMQEKRSDIIGRLELLPSENFKINYNFSADNNFDTLNYNFVEGKFQVNNFITSFEFLEENNLIGSDSYFSNKIDYKFNDSSSIKYSTRRNRRTDLTEYYKLMYEYKNDCLVAAIEYNKDYYEDRDIKPNEEILFTLTLTPFTSVNSPNFEK